MENDKSHVLLKNLIQFAWYRHTKKIGNVYLTRNGIKRRWHGVIKTHHLKEKMRNVAKRATQKQTWQGEQLKITNLNNNRKTYVSSIEYFFMINTVWTIFVSVAHPC